MRRAKTSWRVASGGQVSGGSWGSISISGPSGAGVADLAQRFRGAPAHDGLRVLEGEEERIHREGIADEDRAVVDQATASAAMPSPHGLSRGKAARSSSRTSAPARRAAIAAAAPAGPAPTIATSNRRASTRGPSALFPAGNLQGTRVEG